MSHYRDLNKELVEQVQTMRKNMKLYCDEIVLLKGELMQKHETEVFLRKQCYNWAIKSFLQLVQFVQPDSDILPILLEQTQSEQGMSTCPTERRPQCRGRRSASRRSSLITRNLQKSNSLINLRKSLRSTSPIRRSSNEVSDIENNEQSPTTGQNEAIESAEFADNEATEYEVTQTIRRTDVGRVIYEETDEMEEDYIEKSSEVESVYDSDDDEASNDTHKEQTLQEPRTCKSNRRNFDRTKSFHLDKSNCQTRNSEETLNSLTSILNDMTLKNFQDAACSTPNSRQNSLESTTTTIHNCESIQTSSSSVSTRPSRHCKPKNLAEPHLNTKMRNEMKPSSRKRNSSKSKTKTKKK